MSDDRMSKGFGEGFLRLALFFLGWLAGVPAGVLIIMTALAQDWIEPPAPMVEIDWFD